MAANGSEAPEAGAPNIEDLIIETYRAHFAAGERPIFSEYREAVLEVISAHRTRA
jgi:hypothetical protein